MQYISCYGKLYGDLPNCLNLFVSFFFRPPFVLSRSMPACYKIKGTVTLLPIHVTAKPIHVTN